LYEKNKTKGESPEEMITPKDIRKVKEAVREQLVVWDKYEDGSLICPQK